MRLGWPTKSPGSIVPMAMMASAILAFVTVFSLLLFPDETNWQAVMRIEPLEQTLSEGDTFEVKVIVESYVPVNVFAGEVHFNHELLRVKSIDYNTSVANLWAELPWYSNGEGTLNFAGGTTQQGGFVGTGSLISVVFESKQSGQGVISLHRPRILLHDGLGTDADVGAPIDAIITVESEKPNLISLKPLDTVFVITKNPPSTDLNDDGKQTAADVSIFMLNMLGNDARYDFDQDGKVGLKDLNILLSAK